MLNAIVLQLTGSGADTLRPAGIPKASCKNAGGDQRIG